MRIVMIGTGNIATVLGKKLKAAGHTIVQVYGRQAENAAALATMLNAGACSDWDALNHDADLYMVALSDQAVMGLEKHLQLHNRLVVHTAGAVPMQVLRNVSSSYGVFYPLQTIRKEIEQLPEIPFLLDANSVSAKEQLQVLARTISGNVSMAGDEERLKYHLCAVMTNNFSNYLYVQAAGYCEKTGLAFQQLLPLIDETAARLHHATPRSVQTGPAARKDLGTIEKHLGLLKDEPQLTALYKFFTDQILNFNWTSNDNHHS
ncbi:MAG: DUF2520 domain-containing protein [Chitinophagaceae bacterium]